MKTKLLVIVLAAAFLSTCSNPFFPEKKGVKDSGEPNGGLPQQLASPSNLQIDGATLTWNAVVHASGYTLDIDGIEYPADTAEFLLSVLTDYKTYTIKVKAIGNGTTYTDSEWSPAIEYEFEEPALPALDTPENLEISGTDLTWDDVTGALRYSVEINDVEHEAEANSYSLSALTEAGTYTIKVKAIGDNVSNKNSEWSQPITYEFENEELSPLETPTNVAINGTDLTWDEVAGAIGYLVDVDGAEYQTTENSYSLASLTDSGIYTIKVKAIGNGTTYTDSEWSEPQEYMVSQQLATPSNLTINGITLTWTAVSNASSYLVDIDGTEHSATTNTYSLLSLTAFKTYTIKVKAIGNGTTYTDSAWSGNVQYTVEPTPGLEFTLIGGGTAYSVSKGTASAAIVIIPPVYNGLPVTTIVTNGFQLYQAMTNVIIPDSVTSIAPGAFWFCDNLTSVIIPDGVKVIYNNTFRSCMSLTSVTIPNGVTYIAYDAFLYCHSLTSVTIPNSVTSIGNRAFESCHSLTSVTFATGSNISSADFYSNAFPQGTSSGDNLKTAYIAGGAGTYTRAVDGEVWTRQ